MKKTIFLSIALVCFALGTSLLINSEAKKHINPLAFANIEALTEDEPGLNEITCYSTFRITSNDPEEDVWVITDCNGCEEVNVFEYRDKGTCTKKTGAIFV
ncbi:MAG TPA: NVEALA domain-containing protein [Bacteroidales bacterium]|jgi:hypothetical protein|nr:NVEALA domain-containing protein [Bacteroidales bacterium]HPM10369.1 NVEALA domain-containing protein [Paludibacter sp.]